MEKKSLYTEAAQYYKVTMPDYYFAVAFQPYIKKAQVAGELASYVSKGAKRIETITEEEYQAILNKSKQTP